MWDVTNEFISVVSAPSEQTIPAGPNCNDIMGGYTLAFLSHLCEHDTESMIYP